MAKILLYSGKCNDRNKIMGSERVMGRDWMIKPVAGLHWGSGADAEAEVLRSD